MNLSNVKSFVLYALFEDGEKLEILAWNNSS